MMSRKLHFCFFLTDKYKIKYGVAEVFKAKDNGFQEPAYKEEPVVISLDSVSTFNSLHAG